MKDSLKDYINNNRESFDELEPRDLWTNIDQALAITSSDLTQDSSKTNSASFKKIKNMFKYGFGASALIIGTFFLVNVEKEIPSRLASIKKIEKETPQISEEKKIPVSVNNEENKISETKSPSVQSDINSLPNVISTTTQQKDSFPEEPIQKAIVPYFITKAQPEDSVTASDLATIDTLFKNVKKLIIKVDYCDVNVNVGSPDQVRAHGIIEPQNYSGSYIIIGRKAYQKSEDVLRFDKQNEILTVWMERKKVNKKMHTRAISKKASILNLEVPLNTAVEVNNSSGNVNIKGMESENMVLRTSFGNLKVENVTSNITVNSSSGNLCLININGPVKSTTSFGKQLLQNIHGDVTVTASSGDVTLREIKGNAEVRTSFGAQTIDDVKGNLNTKASSGDLRIKKVTGNIIAGTSFGKQVYENIDGNLSSAASSGDIVITSLKGVLDLKTTFGDIKGKDITLIKSGDFITSSGDIHLNFLNEMKDLSFDLKSSSGKLLVEKNNAKNSSEGKLQMGDGTIQIKGTSTFGDQIYN